MRIYYELIKPKAGAIFVSTERDSTIVGQVSHMYTMSRFGGARIWFPCLDNLSEKSTFELEVTAENPNIVIASGELVKKVSAPHSHSFSNIKKKLYNRLKGKQE